MSSRQPAASSAPLPPSSPIRHPELRALTALRFFAAFAVVLFHYGQAPLRAAPEWMQRLASHGFFGVTLFFILSGFILVYASAGDDLDDGRTRRHFYLRRFARIYPVYFLGWALAGSLLLAHWLREGASIAYVLKASFAYGGLSLVLLQAWVPQAAYVWNAPGWSLSVELFFYASFPFLLPWCRRLSHRRLWAAAVALCVVQALGSGLLQACRQFAAGMPAEEAVVWQDWLAANPLLHVPEFLFGMVLGRLFLLRCYPSWVAPRAGVASAGVAVAVLTVLALPLADAAFRLVLPPLFGAMILLLAIASQAARGSGRPGPSMHAALMLGRASFATYILQNPLWYWFCTVTGAPVSSDQPWPFFAAYLALLIVVSILIYRYVEKPMEALIRRRWLSGSGVTRHGARTVIQ